MWNLYGIDYSQFIRTTDPYHIKGAQALVAKLMDRDHVLSLLSELRQLLEKDDFRAVRSLDILTGALSAGIAGDEMADLEKHIEGYDFEEALEILSVVEQKLNDKLK